MQVTFICPACRASISAPPSLQGESTACPKCNAAIASWPAPVGSPPKVRIIPPPAEPPVWYYSVNGARRGPVTATQLKVLAESGMLRPSDLLWREGLPQWIEARTVPGLFPGEAMEPPAPASAPTPIPPPPPPPPPAHRDEEDDRRPRRRERRRGFNCPYCGSEERPIIRQQVSAVGWVVFALLLIFTIIFCFIGLFIKEDVRICRDCGARLP